jgi:hypothetical protein
MTHPHSRESRTLHNIRNHLSVIIGYCDLLLAEIRPDDPRHGDLTEIRNAATAAMTLLEGATDIR